MYNPEYHKFEKVTTLKKFERNIENLITCSISNIQRPLDWTKSYAIPLTFKNFETVIIVSKHKDSFEINIVNKKGKYCLEFIIMVQKSNVYGYLDMVKVLPNCIIPSSKSGTWMVNLVSALGKSLGLYYIELVDRAKVKNKDHIEEKLWLIRVYSGKYSSWYEEFGYRFVKNHNVENSMKALHDLKILFMKKDFPEITKNTKLGPFALKLWNSPQKIYEKFYNILKNTVEFKSIYNNLSNKMRGEMVLET